MPNITCPYCGTEYESNAKRCPSCGAENKLKICPVCGAQIARGAKNCPRCGAKNKRPFYQLKWFCILLILLCAFLWFCAGKVGKSSQVQEETLPEPTHVVTPTPTPTPTQTPTPTLVPEVDPLELVGGIEGTDGYSDAVGWIHITGQVKNNSGKMLNYVSIQFSLYDINDNVVGTAMDNISNLGDGETWKFEAMAYVNGEVSSYVMTDLSGNAF